MQAKIEKTYHVHVTATPHKRSESFPEANSGCRFNVQRIHKTKAVYTVGRFETYGTVDFGTCSRIKLWFYLRWLNLRGYRKDKGQW